MAFLFYIIGLSLQYPITNKIKIIAHPRISKAPIGRNKTARIMVMSKLLIPIQKPHNKFFISPIAEIVLIIVKAQKRGARDKGWVSISCCIIGIPHSK
jgi:hypothetical protein